MIFTTSPLRLIKKTVFEKLDFNERLISHYAGGFFVPAIVTLMSCPKILRLPCPVKLW